jgi:hypothetical protein
VPDERLKLAYDAASAHLGQQDETLGNLRDRATGLLSAAALVTSFAAGLGLINTDPKNGRVFPVWAAVLLLVLLIGIGLVVLQVNWPVQKWAFGPSAAGLLEFAGQGYDLDKIVKAATTGMVKAIIVNEAVIVDRARYLRFAMGLLVAEIAVITVALIA